jgi:Mg-chelatase subunit ChlI
MSNLNFEKNTKVKRPFPFVRFVGQDDLKLALCLVLIDVNIGGLIILGEQGTGKSMIVRSLIDLLPNLDVVSGDPFNSSPTERSLMGPEVLARFDAGEKLEVASSPTPLVDLPLGATDDRVCGNIDIEKALSEGVKSLEPGLLAKANRGILYLDEVNLLDDSLVDVILDSAACGVNTVEREGISVTHPAKFVMIGSGDPKEGDMRPQMLDRFGLSVKVSTLQDIEQCSKVVLNRLEYDTDPEAYSSEAAIETAILCQKLSDARERAPNVRVSRKIQIKISDLCSRLNIDGLRGDIVVNRAAKSKAALEGREEVTIHDVQGVLGMCLGHRLKKDPFDTMDGYAKVESLWSRVLDTPTSSLENSITSKTKSA